MGSFYSIFALPLVRSPPASQPSMPLASSCLPAFPSHATGVKRRRGPEAVRGASAPPLEGARRLGAKRDRVGRQAGPPPAPALSRSRPPGHGSSPSHPAGARLPCTRRAAARIKYSLPRCTGLAKSQRGEHVLVSAANRHTCVGGKMRNGGRRHGPWPLALAAWFVPGTYIHHCICCMNSRLAG